MMLITEDYREQNRQLHADRADYGTSGRAWAPQVRPLADWGRKAILDFGCGKATLSQRLGPAYPQLPPLGAIEPAGALPQRPVLAVELDLGRALHTADCR